MTSLKKLFSCALILTGGFLFSQEVSEDEMTIRNTIWNTGDAAFKSTTFPDKWNNESAVILATEMYYLADYKTKMTGLTSVSKYWVSTVTTHHRIKLIDKAAVKEFSELTFNEKFINKNIFGKSKSYFFIGIKIIKSNGKEKILDLSKAVDADSDDNNDLKIAVPDLEPGDIIDYFSTGKHDYLNGYQRKISDNFLLEASYPTVKRIIKFKVPNECSLESTAFNGSPDFVRTAVDRDVIYLFEDNMREKYKDILWNYPHRTAPEIRFVLRTGSVADKTPSEIASSFVSGYGASMNMGFVYDYMNINFKKEKDQDKLVRELYYMLRNPIYLSAFFGIEQGHPLSLDYVNDESFPILKTFMTKNKISHNLMVLPYRTYGPFSEQKTIAADIVLRVNTAKPTYLRRIDPFSIPGEVDYQYEGMVGILSETAPRMKEGDTYKEQKTVEVSGPQQNETSIKFEVKLNQENNSKVDVKRNTFVTGHNKPDHQYMVVTNYDYLKEYNLPKYQVESSSLIKKTLMKYNEDMKNLEQRLAQDYNARDKKLKEDVESSMGVKVEEYKDFKLKTIGMWDETPNTEYSDAFIIENIVKKAGQNYIIELPKLIEKQTKVEAEEVKRDKDVYMNYARSFKNEIAFEIPEGYAIEGLEALNKKVDNETGSFTSSYQLEGNKLVIKTHKVFKVNHCEAVDWPKMQAFLDSAVDFMNTKLLVKKK